MTDLQYTGKEGWGVIAEFRKSDRPPYTVQGTLFSIHDSSPKEGGEVQIHIPPVADNKVRKTPEMEAVFDPTQARLFPADGGDLFEVLKSPLLIFPNRKIYTQAAKIEHVRLPDGSEIEVPDNFEELAERYDLKYANLLTLFFIHEQARGIVLSREINDRNLFFEADTSFGKTALMLYLAAIELTKPDTQVLILTPTASIVQQIANKDAKLLFDFPQGIVATLSGETANVKRRQEVYADPNIRLMISTPDIFNNDIKNGLIDPKRFNLALLDEADKGIGDTGYLEAGSRLAKDGILIRGFSATLPDKDERMHEMLDGLKIERDSIHRLHSPPKKIFRKTVRAKLKDPLMLEAATELYNLAARCAEEIERTLIEATKTDNGILPHEIILKNFKKITKLDKNNFVIPTSQKIEPLMIAISKASNLDRMRFGLSYSMFAEFNYRCHMYHLITRFGKAAFLSYLASDYWSFKYFTPRRKNKPRGLYFERVYGNEKLLRVFMKVAGNSCFNKLLDPTYSIGRFSKELGLQSWADRKTALQLKFLKAEKNKKKSSHDTKDWKEKWWEKQRKTYAKEVREAFLKKALFETANDPDWYDGPGLAFLKDIARLHSSFGRDEQIIAATDSSEVTQFYPLVLDSLLSSMGKSAVPFAGVVHMKFDEREENLSLFNEHEAQVLIGTNGAIQIGLDTKASVLVALSTEVTVAGRKQLEGRIGRKGQLCFSYAFILDGTPDFIRLYAAYRRMREEEKIAQD